MEFVIKTCPKGKPKKCLIWFYFQSFRELNTADTESLYRGRTLKVKVVSYDEEEERFNVSMKFEDCYPHQDMADVMVDLMEQYLTELAELQLSIVESTKGIIVDKYSNLY